MRQIFHEFFVSYFQSLHGNLQTFLVSLSLSLSSETIINLNVCRLTPECVFVTHTYRTWRSSHEQTHLSWANEAPAYTINMCTEDYYDLKSLKQSLTHIHDPTNIYIYIFMLSKRSFLRLKAKYDLTSLYVFSYSQSESHTAKGHKLIKRIILLKIRVIIVNYI